MEEKYPNQAQVNSEPVEVHENNHFKDHDKDDLRKRYTRFSILMEYLNENLELDRHASVEQFAHRIRDLVYANKLV